MWARGYWVVTSGNVTDEVWKEYIKGQTPPEPDEDFHFVKSALAGRIFTSVPHFAQSSSSQPRAKADSSGSAA